MYKLSCHKQDALATAVVEGAGQFGTASSEAGKALSECKIEGNVE